MMVDEKRMLIEEYRKGASAFDDTLSMEGALLHFRPFEGAWTIHEHVVHVLESDMATYNRYRSALARPGAPVLGYDEELFTARLDYAAHDLAETVALLKLLRAYVAAHLGRIAGLDWAEFHYTHDALGKVDLEAWLRTYVEHVGIHREYIERNIRLYRG